MTSRRHGLPKKRPTSNKQQDIAEDLPTLEPMDDLPTLEPVAEDLPTLEPVEAAESGPVRTSGAAAEEPNFDFALTLEVAAMDKAAVVDAIRAPLTKLAERHAAALRFRRIVVRFTGEAMVGSAAKEVVAGILKPHKPARVVVRRGFGDEQVLEATPPTLAVATAVQGNETRITVDTKGLDAADLAALLPPAVQELAAKAKGGRFVVVFQGDARPDAALRERIAAGFQAAGARSAAIGARVLFDRDLTDRVQVQTTGTGVTVQIAPAAEALLTREALQMVLPTAADALVGKAVRVVFTAPVGDGERALAIELVKAHGPARIAVAEAGGAEVVVHPPLLAVTAGAEVLVRVQPNGRDPAAVLAAFRSEWPMAAKALPPSAPLCVDWPAGTRLDAAVETLVAEIGAGRRVACTVAGEQREPFVPAPVAIEGGSGSCVVKLDTDAGKPAELVRALERRIPAAAAQLRGATAVVQFAGAAAPSRTLQKALVTALERAGCRRIEAQSGSVSDVWSPALLTVTVASNGVRVGVEAGGRSPAQIELALRRELETHDVVKGANCTVLANPAAEAVAAALVVRGAARVLLDGPTPVVVHPALFAPGERTGTELRLRAAPTGDAAMVRAQVQRELPRLCGEGQSFGRVTVVWPGAGDPPSGPLADVVAQLVARGAGEVHLDSGDGRPFQVHPPVPVLELAPEPEVAPAGGSAALASPAPAAPAASVARTAAGTAAGLVRILARRDEAVPPLLLLGIDANDDAAHIAAVRAALEPHLARLRGRAVLLVAQRGGVDLPVRKSDGFTQQIGALVAGSAAATLWFRGPDAQGRPHFQVVQSTLRALPVGGTFGDPRGAGK